MRLASFGVVGSALIALVVLGALISLASLVLSGFSQIGVVTTLALVVVAVTIAAVWGRLTAPRRWRTPYW